jgi:hypothetical protein
MLKESTRVRSAPNSVSVNREYSNSICLKRCSFDDHTAKNHSFKSLRTDVVTLGDGDEYVHITDTSNLSDEDYAVDIRRSDHGMATLPV